MIEVSNTRLMVLVHLIYSTCVPIWMLSYKNYKKSLKRLIKIFRNVHSFLQSWIAKIAK